MKKALSISFAMSLLLFVITNDAKAQTEYAYCNYNAGLNQYACEGKSIYNQMFDGFTWYVTIPSGQLSYSVNIWLYDSPGVFDYGYVWIGANAASVTIDTYNTTWVNEQGTLNVGTDPVWIDSEIRICNGELTMSAGW